MALPVSWQIIGMVLLGSIAAAAVFIASASYARVETVTGELALDRGVANIIPARRGVVWSLSVAEGDRVQAGAELVRVRAEEDLMSGASANDRIRDSLRVQDRLLREQARNLLTAASSENAKLAAQTAGLEAEVDALDRQIAGQRELVEAASTEFQQIEAVAAKGFISRRDLEGRRNIVVERQQQLAQLEQQRAAKDASVVASRRSSIESAAAATVQSAATESQRANLAQQVAQADLAEGYTLRSPISGRVTAMVARVGQSLAAEASVMSIVPDRSVPRAELYVPTSAIGFLERGQEVRLAVDAFPYQRFGTLSGRIDSIASAPIVRPGAQGNTNAYLVTVSLARPWIAAFGRRQPLLPGMSLSARIVTQRRTLLSWLMEPVIAVRKR